MLRRRIQDRKKTGHKQRSCVLLDRGQLVTANPHHPFQRRNCDMTHFAEMTEKMAESLTTGELNELTAQEIELVSGGAEARFAFSAEGKF